MQITRIQNLNSCANRMVSSVVHDTSAQRIYIRNFLREANLSGQQGNALVAYYTAFNKYLARTDVTHSAAERIEALPAIISKIADKIPAIKEETRTFVKALQKNYPKTLANRISLASQGAVSADKIEPKSKFKKFMVFINRLVDED